MISKLLGLYYFNKRWIPEAPLFATLLLSAGLTVGTITVQLALDLGFLDPSQFSITLIAVLLSAIIPTSIAKSNLVKADLECIFKMDEGRALGNP